MSTDHDFSPHNSARDAPAAQSSRKVPWSGMVDSASADNELPAYTALYGQLGDEELVIRKIAREGARFSGSLCGKTLRA